MNGREQPYINGNGTGTYEPTQWLDDIPGILEGTPQDEQHFNNMETGINGSNLLGEFLAEVVSKQQKRLDDVDGEVDYIVDAEIQGDTVNVGDIVVYDKQVNGFKVKFTGSAASVALKLYVHGGNAA